MLSGLMPRPSAARLVQRPENAVGVVDQRSHQLQRLVAGIAELEARG